MNSQSSTTYTDLFFDFDDTLFDTRGNANASLAELFELHNLGRFFANLEAFTQPYWESNTALWAQYAREEISKEYLIVERFRRPLSLAKDLDITEELCLQFHHDFMRLNSQKTGIVDGADHLLRHLQARGYRMHICSNGFADVLSQRLQQAGLQSFFATTIASETAGANKPSPHFFDYALSQTGAELSQTIMIGDSFENDIQGVAGVGMASIFFNRHPDSFVAPPVATYEVSSLREIEHIL